jgi:hypothetical protein
LALTFDADGKVCQMRDDYSIGNVVTLDNNGRNRGAVISGIIGLNMFGAHTRAFGNVSRADFNTHSPNTLLTLPCLNFASENYVEAGLFELDELKSPDPKDHPIFTSTYLVLQRVFLTIQHSLHTYVYLKQHTPAMYTFERAGIIGKRAWLETVVFNTTAVNSERQAVCSAVSRMIAVVISANFQGYVFPTTPDGFGGVNSLKFWGQPDNDIFHIDYASNVAYEPVVLNHTPTVLISSDRPWYLIGAAWLHIGNVPIGMCHPPTYSNSKDYTDINKQPMNVWPVYKSGGENPRDRLTCIPEVERGGISAVEMRGAMVDHSVELTDGRRKMIISHENITYITRVVCKLLFSRYYDDHYSLIAGLSLLEWVSPTQSRSILFTSTVVDCLIHGDLDTSLIPTRWVWVVESQATLRITNFAQWSISRLALPTTRSRLLESLLTGQSAIDIRDIGLDNHSSRGSDVRDDFDPYSKATDDDGVVPDETEETFTYRRDEKHLSYPVAGRSSTGSDL